MENQSQNELYFAVELAVIVTVLQLMYKHTDYTWSSSLSMPPALSTFFVTCKCPNDLYRAKELICNYIFSLELWN